MNMKDFIEIKAYPISTAPVGEEILVFENDDIYKAVLDADGVWGCYGGQPVTYPPEPKYRAPMPRIQYHDVSHREGMGYVIKVEFKTDRDGYI